LKRIVSSRTRKPVTDSDLTPKRAVPSPARLPCHKLVKNAKLSTKTVLTKTKIPVKDSAGPKKDAKKSALLPSQELALTVLLLALVVSKTSRRPVKDSDSAQRRDAQMSLNVQLKPQFHVKNVNLWEKIVSNLEISLPHVKNLASERKVAQLPARPLFQVHAPIASLWESPVSVKKDTLRPARN